MSAADAANVHAVALAAGDRGLLVLGESGAGKSLLAARMIADWPFGHARLVADDRVLLTSRGGRLVARPHPALIGRLEVRGWGIVQAEALESVVVAGLLRLSPEPPPRLPDEAAIEEELLGLRLPCLRLPPGEAAFQRLVAIWPYFHGSLIGRRSILAPAP